jgi:enoyl reductase-like protein
MTRDEIIEMAKQTQMPFYWRTGEITYLDKLEDFAKLVAQHEREACAKLARQFGGDWAEDAIRARNKE